MVRTLYIAGKLTALVEAHLDNGPLCTRPSYWLAFVIAVLLIAEKIDDMLQGVDRCHVAISLYSVAQPDDQLVDVVLLAWTHFEFFGASHVCFSICITCLPLFGF